MYREIEGRKKEGNWRIYPYVQDIQMRKEKFDGFECTWISRNANKAADWVANQVKKGMCESNWVGLPPSSLVHL